MAKKFHEAVRMCISCRERMAQDSLIRLQCEDGDLQLFKGSGRSFYLCNECVSVEKKVLKALMRQCRSGNKEKFLNKLKEIIPDDRKS